MDSLNRRRLSFHVYFRPVVLLNVLFADDLGSGRYRNTSSGSSVTGPLAMDTIGRFEHGCLTMIVLNGLTFEMSPLLLNKSFYISIIQNRQSIGNDELPNSTILCVHNVLHLDHGTI